MTYSDTQPRGTLRYCLLASTMSKEESDPGSWGHEYIRHLAGELGPEFSARLESQGDIEELRSLGMVCAKFLLSHHAEPDAVDLLAALECIERIVTIVDENVYARVCAYMVGCVASYFSTLTTSNQSHQLCAAPHPS